MHWVTLPLKRYAEFRGRSRRLEFWSFQLAVIVIYVVLFFLMMGGIPFAELASDNPDPNAFGDMGILFWIGWGLLALFVLAIFVPSLAVTVRRLHDRNMSGWWYGGLLIASFIPIVNVVAIFGYLALLVILLLPGTEGPNRYGPDPKDASQAGVFE